MFPELAGTHSQILILTLKSKTSVSFRGKHSPYWLLLQHFCARVALKKPRIQQHSP